MPKQTIPFNDFLSTTGAEHEEFINSLHQFLADRHCTHKIKTAANGYVVSYVHKPSKRTVANYIFRNGRRKMNIRF